MFASCRVPEISRTCGKAHTRLIFPAAALLLSLMLPFPCGAAEVVLVSSSDDSPYMAAKNALEQDLGRRGYTNRAVLLDHLIDMKSIPVDPETKVVVSIGSPAAAWLHNRIKPPVILSYCMVSDPEGTGLNDDPPLEGISTRVPLDKQFRLIARALPRVSSVGMIYRGDGEGRSAILKEVQKSLPAGWRLEAVDLGRYKSIAEAINALLDKDIDIVWTYPDSAVYDRATIRSLLLAALRNKTPVFGYSLSFVRAGALLGVTINAETQGKQSAALVHHLLTSGKDTDLEAMKEVRFEIVVNLIVAERLEIDLPGDLIKRAEHVIKQ